MSNQNQNINQEKFDQFVEKLYSMGYGPELEEQETNEDIINMLEKHHLHEQDFDFPEGNWENFKDSVLAGKYDAELEFDDNSSSMKEIIKRYSKGECTLDINMSQETWLRMRKEALQEIYNENENTKKTI